MVFSTCDNVRMKITNSNTIVLVGLSFLTACALVFAVPAYAQSQTYVSPSTADQLRDQAQALLARVQQLQGQLGEGDSAPVIKAGTGSDSSSCPLIGRSLKKGSSGDDVGRLQQFLARDSEIYRERLVTGYYGGLTEAAVRRWQVKYNIVSSGSPDSTGYGVVGPRTAAAIAILCTTGSYGGVPGPNSAPAPVGGFIQITPIAGNAPLDVAIQATVNTVNSCSGATYILDYGDRTPPTYIAVPVGDCTQLVQALAHQYQNSGTYLVTLSAGRHRTSATVQVNGAGQPPPGPAPSPNPTTSTTWAIVSVTPAVGGNPFAVSLQIAYPRCVTHSIDWGDGNIPASVLPQGDCSVNGSSTANHIYYAGGNYTISLRDENGAVKATAGVTII